MNYSFEHFTKSKEMVGVHFESLIRGTNTPHMYICKWILIAKKTAEKYGYN